MELNTKCLMKEKMVMGAVVKGGLNDTRAVSRLHPDLNAYKRSTPIECTSS
jgi:hypothetical protein